MLSIRPEWVEKILNGTKTVEVRKTAPKIATPFKCYIYCTRPKLGKSHQHDAFGLNGKPVECGGKVVAEFICDKIKLNRTEFLIAKVLEWLSREAYESEHFYVKWRNDQVHEYHLNGINRFCGTSFTPEDMEIIYTYLGNSCNHKKTLTFIRSGYDLYVLRR